MIDLGPHVLFIVSAYAGVVVAVAALIAYVVFDARRIRLKLQALDEKGIRRRSAGKTL